MPFPRITLVTPSFNQGQFLEATIRSVLDQNYPNLEYIIIDGGSTDNSADIIRRYEKHLAYWQSKPDKGQSDALIQGFSRATGDLMNWVNSDDLLAPGALDHLAALYQSNPAADIITGAIDRFHHNPLEPFETYLSKGWSTAAFLRLTPRDTFAFNQPASFFTRHIYQRAGGLNSDFHYCMDYDLFLRMCELAPKIVYTDRTIAWFRHHKDSKTTSGTARNLVSEHSELLRIFLASSRRTGLTPNISYSSDLLHRLFAHSLYHADFATARQAWHSLRKAAKRNTAQILRHVAAQTLHRLRA